MKCQNSKCNSERIIEIQVPAETVFYAFDGEEYEDVHPVIDNIADGEYVDMAVCLECGQVQGEFPAEDPDFSADDEDEGEDDEEDEE